MTQPLLSVIILNYKNVALTSKCVGYVIDSSIKAKIKTEIIIIDNSGKETGKDLKKILPVDTVIIENMENLGFSKANNQGIIASEGKYILLLNNDAFINSECLTDGINYLKDNKNCGIWAPKLVGEDGSFQISCACLPTLNGLIREYLFSRDDDCYPDLRMWKEPHNVGNVVGAFILMKKDIIEKVGLLDEDYFFTVEDVDFCKRVHEAGFSVIYDPRYKIVHIGGASQEDKWLKDPYMHKYRVLYFRKNYGILKEFLARIIIFLGLNFRKVLVKYHELQK